VPSKKRPAAVEQLENVKLLSAAGWELEITGRLSRARLETHRCTRRCDRGERSAREIVPRGVGARGERSEQTSSAAADPRFSCLALDLRRHQGGRAAVELSGLLPDAS